MDNFGKLDAVEKQTRKALKSAIEMKGGGVFFFADTGVTVALCPRCPELSNPEIFDAAVTLGKPGDKLRRKRGELIALERWDSLESIPVRRRGFRLEMLAESIASIVV